MTAATVVVTGGAGFIGRTLVAKLAAEGQRVVVLDNLLQFRDREPPELSAELVVGDVRDRGLVLSLLERSRPETVYHLAAIHFIPACEADPAECISVNVAGTAALLEACSMLTPIPACVLASSGAVYAPSLYAHREEETPAPIDVYGLSKLWMEQLAALFARRHGMPVAVARLFNTYGPGETNPHFIPTLLDQVMAGGAIRVGNIDSRRDYVHVSDVARALAAMPGRSQTLNIGGGRAISGHEVIEAVERAVGRRLDVQVDASQVRKVDQPVLLSDSTKARELLGWRPEVVFEEGIAELVAGVRV